jgi:hypothetical protein
VKPTLAIAALAPFCADMHSANYYKMFTDFPGKMALH